MEVATKESQDYLRMRHRECLKVVRLDPQYGGVGLWLRVGLGLECHGLKVVRCHGCSAWGVTESNVGRYQSRAIVERQECICVLMLSVHRGL